MLHIRIKRLLLAIALLAASYACWARLSSADGEQRVAYQPSHAECFSGTGTVPWRACLHTAPGGTNGGLAYHFHGRNLDENTWNDDTYYTSLIQEHWSRRGLVPPKVASVSFGPVWLLMPKTANARSGLLDVFEREVIPEVERRTGTPTYRAVIGESMGGVNSLIAGLSLRGTFQKAIALCPTIYKDSPLAPVRTIRDFLHRTGADPKVVLGMLWLARDYARDDAEWKSISPLELLESIDPATAPKLYVSCGLYDKYGNFEGAEHLARRARERGLEIEWHPLYGGHCAIDVASVADFLARAP